MTPKEVRKLNDEELDVEIERLKRRHFELRTQSVTEKIEDTSQFAKIKKDSARLLTEQNSRRRAATAEA
ncbi:MAG: 50S ribosomal protein L29 [Planctomycetota bacterium]|nr:50S ribosomal protein L29 [Planctomycetota bacterium]